MLFIRVSLIFTATLFTSLFCHAQTTPGIEKIILTKWINEDGTKVIEFLSNDSQFYAVIRKAKDQALVGQQQLSGLHCLNSECKNGTFYLIKRGLAFPCSVIMKSATEIEISVKSGSNTKSQIWTKLTH